MANPKLTYNSIKVQFPMGVKNLGQPQNQIIVVNRSDDGAFEHNSFYTDEIISFLLETYDAFFESELERFFAYMKTGQTGKLIIDPDVALYISFSGKSTNTNDASILSFTRSGATGTYLDRSTGLIKTAAANEARFQSGKYTEALLIESTLTNLLDDTEDFTQASWVKTNATITANQLLGPDGTKTADKFVTTAANGNIVYTTATAISTNSATFTVWLKSLDIYLNAHLVIADDSPTDLKDQAIVITPEWQRFECKFPTAGANANNWVVRIEIERADTAYIKGAQLETALYETSYVKDAGTRSQDKARYTLSKDWWNHESFSLSAWIKVPYDYDEILSDKYLFLIYDEANTNEFLKVLIESGSSGFTIITEDAAGGNPISETIATTALTKDVWHYIVVTVQNVSNGISLYIDGTLIDSTTNSPYIPWETPDELLLGCPQDGVAGGELDGLICDVLLENRILTAAEISSRYNFSYGMGIKKNRFDAVYLNDFNWNPDRRNGVPRFSKQLEFINSNT